MEDKKVGGTSDKDTSMMRTYESYADKDKEDSKEKSKKKSDKKPTIPLFGASKEEVKAEADKPKPLAELFEDKNEKVEEAEKEVPLEELADDEKQLVAEQYIDNRTEDIQAEMNEVPEDSPEEAAALANAAFLEALRSRLQEVEAPDEAVLDEVADETVAELGLDTEEELSPEVIEEDSEAEEDDVAVPPSPPPPPPRGPTGTPPGGGTIPPAGGNFPPLGGPPAGPNINVGPPSPNILSNTQEAEDDARERRQALRKGLLVGGVVGYLVGRRRGRIKTEKRLLPIQEKLEKQVGSLQEQIEERELRIRKLAKERAESASPETIKANVERLVERQKYEVQKPNESMPDIMIERKAETVQNKPEFIGRFILGGEVGKEEAAQKSIETLTNNELLEIAAKISFEGITVREMYAQQRLDSVGLRRVVKEYLEGRHYERMLVGELSAVEYKREAGYEKQAAQPLQQDDYSQTTISANTTSPWRDQPTQPMSDVERSIQQAMLAEQSRSQTSKQKDKTNLIIAVVGGLAFALVMIILL